LVPGTASPRAGRAHWQCKYLLPLHLLSEMWWRKHGPDTEWLQIDLGLPEFPKSFTFSNNQFLNLGQKMVTHALLAIWMLCNGSLTPSIYPWLPDIPCWLNSIKKFLWICQLFKWSMDNGIRTGETRQVWMDGTNVSFLPLIHWFSEFLLYDNYS
jgi:hypothetical protein